MQTIIKCTGCDGFDVWDGASAIQLKNLVIVGDGTTNANGISLQDLGRINLGGILAVYGFGSYNIYLNLNAEMNGGTCLLSSGSASHGIFTDSGTIIDAGGQIISSGNAAKGIFALAKGYVRAGGTIDAVGNAGDGFYAIDDGVIDVSNEGWATSNGGYGYHANNGGKIVPPANINYDAYNASGWGLLQFQSGTGIINSLNTQQLVVTDPTAARMGAYVNNLGVCINSTGTYGEVFCYNYASSAGALLTINQNGGNVAIGQSSASYPCDIAGAVRTNAATATPSGGSTSAVLLFGTTTGFGIYYGSGAPTISAAQGSLYLRSDGSSTSTRLYVNTNGSTTWTNLTSAS